MTSLSSTDEVHETLLRMEGIYKSFPGVQALVGENGAGKSMLMKIVGGIYSKDAGASRRNLSESIRR